MADSGFASSGWIGGVATVLVGIAFLWRNQGPMPQIDPTNWWAWLMLLPALMMLRVAWRHWKDDGQVSAVLLSGLLIIWVSMVFLLGLPFNGSWPLMFIFLGTFLVLRSFGR